MGPQRKARVSILALLVLAATAAGCGTVPEPDSELEPMATVDHEPQIVWECMLEAVQNEGFNPDRATRSGPDGYIETNFKKIRTDPISRVDTAQRIRMQMRAKGSDYEILVAASTFEREPGSTGWDWVEADENLRKSVYARFDAAVLRRYKR